MVIVFGRGFDSRQLHNYFTKALTRLSFRAFCFEEVQRSGNCSLSSL